MVFSSALFLTMFFPLVLGFYFLAQERLRNYVLLAASLLFYAWGEPKAVFVMIALIAVSYIAALAIEKYPRYAKMFLVAGIALNLSALLFYKYWMFLLENVNLLSGLLAFKPFNIPKIALPIGISFYVFQILSYLIDVYRKQVSAQKSLPLLATYVSLFPQLVAGPIVRYETIAEDLQNRKTNFDNVYKGLRRFVIGLAKKVLIADQMAFVADSVFTYPPPLIPTVFAWVGALAYTLQIFYDFSGYSDMAIGIGRIFNFRFLENFNYPYCAKSVQDFWRRWHISLSSWFRDYLYIPLGGNRCSKARTYLNSYIVFGLCGLWHGATWNFVVWGLYHGTFLALEKAGLKRLIDRLPAFVANLYVLLFAIVGWVIFRANTLPQAGQFLKIMFCGNPNAPINSFYKATEFLTYSNLIVFVVAIVFSYPLMPKIYAAKRYSKTDCVLIGMLFVVAYVFAITSTFSPFIYFRF